MKGFPTSADIYLELDGRKIAVVQSYRAKAAKSSKNVEAFGESEPGRWWSMSIHKRERAIPLLSEIRENSTELLPLTLKPA